MRSLLLKFLERVGRVRLPMFRRKTLMAVGHPRNTDFRGGFDWRNFRDSRSLSAVWGPRPGSPWTPFHCITLFAAIDYVQPEAIGPCEHDPWPVPSYIHPPDIDPATVLLVDLPGPVSAAVGAALGASGCDLVCTFNNWPHPKGLIRPEETLAALLRYASWLSEKRVFPAGATPVAWLCDSGRLGAATGKPEQFDNRYYLEDSLLPGPRYLRERGVTKLFYLCETAGTVRPDLTAYLDLLQKEGLSVRQLTAAMDGSFSAPIPLTLPKVSFSKAGFFRSTAGGFGAPVPHPSSGG